MGSHREKQKVVVIYGPTAIGKTSLGIALAQAVQGEILSADSMAVYKGLDIGTAKPTLAERGGVLHHLLDLVTPKEPFTVADFREKGRETLDELKTRGCPAIVVGGSGLYIRALLRGLFDGPKADIPLRRQLRQVEGEDPGSMHRRLIEVDPTTAARLHPRDLVRLERALEVFLNSGKPLSEWIREHQFQDLPYDLLEIGLMRPRPILYERINQRVDAMIDGGLLEEVRGLLDAGFDRELKAMKGLGYAHMCCHLLDGKPLGESIQQLKQDTRRFAKRQETWMNGWPTLKRLDANNTKETAAELIEFLI